MLGNLDDQVILRPTAGAGIWAVRAGDVGPRWRASTPNIVQATLNSAFQTSAARSVATEEESLVGMRPARRDDDAATTARDDDRSACGWPATSFLQRHLFRLIAHFVTEVQGAQAVWREIVNRQAVTRSHGMITTQASYSA